MHELSSSSEPELTCTHFATVLNKAGVGHNGCCRVGAIRPKCHLISRHHYATWREDSAVGELLNAAHAKSQALWNKRYGTVGAHGSLDGQGDYWTASRWRALSAVGRNTVDWLLAGGLCLHWLGWLMLDRRLARLGRLRSIVVERLVLGLLHDASSGQ